ncbi:MAG: hypothetical protein JO165_10610 [Candidatus Eremiobacteraeota bacterium]|nr:hypothetical protein [Candidatus Eremiobacteraeota bacterium]
MIKRVFGIALSALIFALPATARADGVSAGITITATHGTHEEANQTVITAPLIPAPILNAGLKHNHVELSAEGLPPIGPIHVENDGQGLRGVRLGYADTSLRFWDSQEKVAFGIGESLYVQRSMYFITPFRTEVDASRVVGGRYEIVGIERLGQTIRFVSSVAVNPRLHAVLTHTFEGPDSAHWYSPHHPESGSQVDIASRIERSRGRATIAFGVRYLNLNMKFDDGSLADRNVFVMPFVSFSTVIGR